MLIKRSLTGIILMTLMLLGIYFLPFYAFLAVTTAITLLAAWEWSLLMQCKHVYCRVLYVTIMALLMLLVWYTPIKPILWTAFIFWMMTLNLIIPYPKLSDLWSSGNWIRAGIGCLVLIPAWLAINVICMAENGKIVLLFLLIIIWSADIGAYLVGKWRGKHALLPQVSPNKTWEGVIGGFLLSLSVLMLVILGKDVPVTHWIPLLFLTLTIVFFAIVGDLFESMLKRQAKLKDTGSYLPGHGGILDRIDSLTAAAPIFLLFCFWLGLL